MTIGDKIDKTIANLETKRDELKVKAHLMKSDARDEFNRLERKVDELKMKKNRLESAGEKTSKDVGEAAEILIDEIQTGFDRLKKAV